MTRGNGRLKIIVRRFRFHRKVKPVLTGGDRSVSDQRPIISQEARKRGDTYCLTERDRGSPLDSGGRSYFTGPRSGLPSDRVPRLGISQE